MCTSSTVCRSGIDGRRRCCSKAGPQLENEIDSQPRGVTARPLVSSVEWE
jgi:hypothetical protein